MRLSAKLSRSVTCYWFFPYIECLRVDLVFGFSNKRVYFGIVKQLDPTSCFLRHLLSLISDYQVYFFFLNGVKGSKLFVLSAWI
jgi:hypothetical protein